MVAFFVAVFAPLLCAQDVDIRVLNGRNGKPITNECLNISLGSWHGGDLIAPTNGGGIVVLHLENGQVTADGASPHACNGMAALGPKALPRGTDTIAVLPAEYMACQEYAKFTPNPAKPKLEALVPPLYSVKRIAESGISASNTCGKFRAEAKPGELIFYVRPRSFLEKWRQ
jgi:hypothetical protein